MKTFADKQTNKTTKMKLGESVIRVEIFNFYHIEQAIEWEVKRQIEKIKKDHISRVWIHAIKSRYSDNITGIKLVFFDNNSSYRQHIRLNRKNMVENMNNAVKKIVEREREVIKMNNFGKKLSSEFKHIVKTDFKKFNLKMEYGDYAIATLPNGIEVKISRVFNKVELGFIPSNKINSLRIIEALSKVKIEERELEVE